MNDPMLELRRRLLPLYPTADAIRGLLELSGIDLDGLDLTGPPDLAWRRALDECQIQGPDALESLMVELLEAHPTLREADLLLRLLARGGISEPAAAEGGGRLTEAVVRDPLEGTELLLAFAEAQGTEPLVVLQLRRCQQVLREIARERRQHGRTLAHEPRWRKVLHEIMDLAHKLQGD
jgi:hypothetical protein